MFLRLSIFITCIFLHKNAGSPLHGACLSNEDCGTIDTFCKNQICVCKENFSVWHDSCVETIRCSKKQECHVLLGPRSMCTKNNQCACKPFHHLHQSQCVKNRDLYDQCEHDHQCYCGVECQEKIACIHKSCTCKPGNKPYRIRRCMDDPAYAEIPDLLNLTTTTVHKHKSVDQAEQNQVLPRVSSTSLSTVLTPEYFTTVYLLMIIFYTSS